MQHPTCTRTRVRSPADAHVIFHAVRLGRLPMITRRLDTEERRAISSGCVFVWEERGGPNTEMGLGIERWTDSIRWGPSRVREVNTPPLSTSPTNQRDFLFYHERPPDDVDPGYDSETASQLGYSPSHALFRENLIKQTYSVFVDTTHGRRKWHLIAYFTNDSVGYLQTVDDNPYLADIEVPYGLYTSGRSHRPRGTSGTHRPVPCPPRRRSPYTMPSSRVHSKLPPLEFLETIPPPCRHPEDEKALMS
ncbi:Gti1/Pac2 family-domain-containing protein, partial [Mycena pura]